MSEMIERVAQAMAESIKTPLYGGLIWKYMGDDDSATDYENRDYWRVLARAAIEAMREPTKLMTLVDGPGDQHTYRDAENAATWRKMIDEALK